MFRGDLQSRVTAVVCFLSFQFSSILLFILISKGGFVRWLTHGHGMDDSLAHEVCSFLNRALTQQLQVRTIVYSSIQQVVKGDKETVQKQFVDMLLEQLDKYFPKDAKLVNLELCIDGDIIVEPVGMLVAASLRLLKYLRSVKSRIMEKKGKDLLDKVSAIVACVQKSDMEDYGLDKSSDFGDSVAGKRNVIVGSLLCTLYVACLEWVTSTENLSVDEITQAVKLFKKHSELTMLMQSGGGGASVGADSVVKKRKKAPGLSKKFEAPINQQLGLDAMKNLFFVLAKPSQDAMSQMIRDEREFHCWIVTHLLQVCKLLFGEDQVAAEEIAYVKEEEKIEFCNAIGPCVMWEYKRDCGVLNTIVAETLFGVVSFVARSVSVEKLATFLEIANPVSKGTSTPQDTLLTQLKSILNFVPPLIIAKNHKEMLIIFNLCGVLIKSLKKENTNLIVDRVTNLLKEDVENVVVIFVCSLKRFFKFIF